MTERKQLTICPYCNFIVYPGRPHTPHPPEGGFRGYCSSVYTYAYDAITKEEKELFDAECQARKQL